MAQLDNKLTEAIKKWLDTAPDERDVVAGATILLQLNRNRAMFNTITRRPQREADRLEYELRKHLRIRLDNMTIADVAKMETSVIPSAKNVIDEPPVVSTDDELPEVHKARGRRADHDALPQHIQSLWDNNLVLYQRIKLLFEELKAMENALPCDRYERLKLLDEADKTYRANLAAYDDYVGAPGEASEAVGDADERQDGVAATSVKQVGAARKTLSKYRQQLARLVTDGDERAEEVRGRLQEAVRVIQAAGAGFAPATQSELEALGVKF